jgi:hypothetical protein
MWVPFNWTNTNDKNSKHKKNEMFPLRLTILSCLYMFSICKQTAIYIGKKIYRLLSNPDRRLTD